MRLWPLAILDQLPRQQLLGQHRECCALRGKGWGRKHATVDYVFRKPYYFLWRYHNEIMKEMSRREYKVSPEWWSPLYRGKTIGFDYSVDVIARPVCAFSIYPEHDGAYLEECISNLARKGVAIDRKKLFNP